KDVARKAGVHPSTASLCLNNSPLVAERTRLRVQRIARDLGYRRHPFVQSLMRERRGRKSSLAAPVLGLINLYPAQDAWKKQIPMFQDCLDAARKRAVSAGFGFEEIWIPLDHCTRAKADTVL